MPLNALGEPIPPGLSLPSNGQFNGTLPPGSVGVYIGIASGTAGSDLKLKMAGT